MSLVNPTHGFNPYCVPSEPWSQYNMRTWIIQSAENSEDSAPNKHTSPGSEFLGDLKASNFDVHLISPSRPTAAPTPHTAQTFSNLAEQTRKEPHQNTSSLCNIARALGPRRKPHAQANHIQPPRRLQSIDQPHTASSRLTDVARYTPHARRIRHPDYGSLQHQTGSRAGASKLPLTPDRMRKTISEDQTDTKKRQRALFRALS